MSTQGEQRAITAPPVGGPEPAPVSRSNYVSDLRGLNLWNATGIGFKEIWSHKFRSALTMFGIVLGVASLVAMSALVKGMENGMKEALIAIGGLEKVRVETQDIPTHQSHLADQAVGNTIQDVYALQKSAPLIKMITPEMGTRNMVLTRKGKTFYPWIFTGTWPNALEMNLHVVEHGRMFNEIDDEQARNVCVIGTAVRDELFGAPEDLGYEVIPIGQQITAGSQVLTIIGMFQHYEGEQERKMRLLEMSKPKQQQTGPVRSRGWGSRRGGSFVFRLKNSTVYLPLNTMWLRFRASSGTNSTPDPKLSNLYLKVADIEQLEPALQQARNVLLHTHKGIEDFAFQTQENWADQIKISIRNYRMSGSIIAAISLLVGGIGIMNIMLASITERIRELGLRKAIGATDLDVFVQIVVESLVIAILGGIAGLVASFVFVFILIMASPTENTPVITMNAMALAFLFSALVGVIAGLFPALKAARLNPIQALRYE